MFPSDDDADDDDDDDDADDDDDHDDDHHDGAEFDSVRRITPFSAFQDPKHAPEMWIRYFDRHQSHHPSLPFCFHLLLM